MEKKTGIHFYINIKNLGDIINNEEKKDDDLKRTLHRLQTYFTGLSKLINDRGAKIEKYTSGRAHIVFETNEEESKIENILEIMVSCFIYNNDIFNDLGKYSQYESFEVHGGADYGDYYDYEIEEEENNELTSIGSVANISAKIQTYAKKDYIYVTKKFVDNLDEEIKSKFIELTEDEKKQFSSKIKVQKIYKAKYSSIFEEDRLEEIRNSLDDIKTRVNEEANKLNLSEITFEGVNKKLSFSDLSLGGKNKKIESCGVLCADIRKFTKLFNANDANLDNLKDVMKEIYSIMGETMITYNGTKVQYQGDRIVVVFHDYGNEEEYIVRMMECAMALKSKIQELNDDEQIKEKLNSKTISIGIGCSIGKVIASRLGLRGNKDNIIIGDAYKTANKAEDDYAGEEEIVIWKSLKEEIDSKEETTDNPKYSALQDIFDSISTTGYYFTKSTIDEFAEKIKEQKNINENAEKQFNKNELRPWSR
ncbi:adenylate/guanylate cyclase domain-containing protein [Clostridium felsineum]|uniref:adenylate/guanylate cyclase domain-containing protein n=1 Tax=Clostridium felsineum TaxID=36839 RepID=UPI0009CFDFE3|nr:adenylate/guanylate cyclase domain-containing protein [Clostridium felsineum]URZ01948.1 hypothetical protein CLAUR_019450 [Clostridium felsineum]